jgi:hypothetical protein
MISAQDRSFLSRSQLSFREINMKRVAALKPTVTKDTLFRYCVHIQVNKYSKFGGTPRSKPKFQRKACHGSGGYSPTSHYGGLGHSMWDLWWTKWHWDRIFFEFLGFSLSISFHRVCSYLYIWEMNNRTVGGRSSET